MHEPTKPTHSVNMAGEIVWVGAINETDEENETKLFGRSSR